MTTARVILLAIAAGGCAQVFQIGEVSPPGEVPSYLVFDNSASPVPLASFPVRVTLDRTTIDYAAAADPTTALRFHDPHADIDLPFEVERWAPGGSSDVWVLVPEIAAQSRTDYIEMYVDSATPSTATGSVWSDYELVAHVDTDLHDSAGGDNDGMLSGATLGSGAIGGGLHLHDDASDSRAIFGSTPKLIDSWGEFSLELWLYADYPDTLCAGSEEPHLLDLEQVGAATPAINSGRLICPQRIPSAPPFVQIDTHTTTHDFFDHVYLPVREWTYLIQSYDGQSLWMYRNGDFASVEAAPRPGPTVPSGGSLEIGAFGQAMAGGVDEVRVSRHHRSIDWAYAQYRVQTGRFVTITRKRP